MFIIDLEKAILDALPVGVVHNRTLPLSVTLKLIVPAILAVQPKKTGLVPVYVRWLEYRGEDLTLIQAAHLWKFIFFRYLKEVPVYLRRWRLRDGTTEIWSPKDIYLTLASIINEHTARPLFGFSFMPEAKGR